MIWRGLKVYASQQGLALGYADYAELVEPEVWPIFPAYPYRAGHYPKADWYFDMPPYTAISPKFYRKRFLVMAQERDRSQAILDCMGEALFALDAQQRVIMVNQAALELLRLEQPPLGVEQSSLTQSPVVASHWPDWQVSPAPQVPSPQPGQGPQSSSQRQQLSHRKSVV